MKNILLALMVFGSFGVSANNITPETIKYIESLPRDVAAPADLKKYNSYQGFKSWAIEVKNGRLDNSFAKRSAQMDSQREADEIALIGCETKFGNDCILYYQGIKNVLKENLYSYNNSTLKGFLSTQVDICKKFGYSSKEVGDCVQSKIDKTMDIPSFDPNQVKPRTQYSQQSRPGVNWGALSNLGACISDGSCWGGGSVAPAPRVPQANLTRTYFLSHDYMDGMNRICVYDGWTETMQGISLCPLTVKR